MGKPSIAFQRNGNLLYDSRSDPDGSGSRLLSEFAELVSAAGDLHTYRVTDLSLWSAAASGRDGDDIVDWLMNTSMGQAPGTLLGRIGDFFGRYGQIRIEGTNDRPFLVSRDAALMREIANLVELKIEGDVIRIDPAQRGVVKATLARAGYPVVDTIASETPMFAEYRLGEHVCLRDYQLNAVERFVDMQTGGGLILLPCGAGKTVVGVAIAARLRAWVLVVVPNRTIGEQWAYHFHQMTDLDSDQISLFGDVHGRNPVTIVTYQALTTASEGMRARLVDASNVPWGMVIYDEVHSLPADVFRTAAVLQSRRRLGLTATLVREDGRERDVYGLVGPPVWQSRWRELESRGWISPVECYEIRIRSRSPAVHQEGPGLTAKIRVVKRIIERHGPEDRVIIAAHYLREVHALGKRLRLPVITGKTRQRERARLYQEFRDGLINRLVVSRVANVGVDLPDANVLIQVSGTFGSRLEEAQRLGRILRPNLSARPSRFYSLVLPGTREQEFAQRRQRFLIDQGYRYQIINTGA